MPNLIQKIRLALGTGDLPDGVHVSALGTLKVSGDSAVMSLSAGGHHEVTMTNSPAGGILVRTISKVSAQADALVDERTYALSAADEARTHFRGTIRKWAATLGAKSAGGGARRWPWLLGGAMGGAAFGVLALVVVSQMMAPQVVAEVQAARSAQVGLPGMVYPPGMGDIPAAPNVADIAAFRAGGARSIAASREAGGGTPADTAAMLKMAAQARLTPAERDKLDKAASIKLGDGKKVLTAFSDPLCPACKDLDIQARGLDKDAALKIIPVAFQSGAKQIVASILCSSDPRKAWLDAMSGEAPSGGACEKGLKAVEANNALFSSIGASATPTIVAPNGQLAQGSADTPDLVRFLNSFSN